MSRLRAWPALLAAGLALAGCDQLPGQGQGPRTVDSAARLRLAEVAERSGNQDIALNMYAAAAAEHPERPGLQLRHALSLARSGQPLAARRILTQALLRAPTDRDLQVALARVQLQLGEAEEALLRLDGLLAATPGNGELANLRGVALDLLGRHAPAQESYRLALRADPSGLAAANNLALSLVLSGQPAEAVRVLEALGRPEHLPARARTTLGLAQLAAQNGGTSQAQLREQLNAAQLASLNRELGIAPPIVAPLPQVVAPAAVPVVRQEPRAARQARRPRRAAPAG